MVVAVAVIIAAANTKCEATALKGFMYLNSFNLGSRGTCFTEALYRCWVLLLIWYSDSIILTYKICFIITSFIDSTY